MGTEETSAAVRKPSQGGGDHGHDGVGEEEYGGRRGRSMVSPELHDHGREALVRPYHAMAGRWAVVARREEEDSVKKYRVLQADKTLACCKTNHFEITPIVCSRQSCFGIGIVCLILFILQIYACGPIFCMS
jgi:hypothetical protein